MMKKTLLWLAALVLAIAAMIYQRSTGPTYEYKGELTLQGESYPYELLRSHETTAGAQILMPHIDDDTYEATLHYKRYQTDDQVSTKPFVVQDAHHVMAELPVQPAAGKMAYYVTGRLQGETFRIPARGEAPIVLRYKDPVPDYILIPHVVMMILTIIFGMRAGLSALFNDVPLRRWAIFAFGTMSIGGMMLGPVVQKYAFGAYWTGFPFGGDFTDNKMLIMWLAWALALAVIGFKPKKKEGVSRAAVVLAAVVMTVVYLIPHSMGGSTLDYDAVDQGVDPMEAIQTGRE